MTDQPKEEVENSFTISLPISEQKENDEDQIPTTHHFNNLVWYVYLSPLEIDPSGKKGRQLIVESDSDGKSELWQAKTMIEVTVKTGDKAPEAGDRSHVTVFKEMLWFNSWKVMRHDLTRRAWIGLEATEVNIKITILDMNFTHRPVLGPNAWIHDAILVVDGQKFDVNKEIFSSMSSYFKNLFNSGPNQEEFEIKEFGSEEFLELLTMVFGGETEQISVDKAIRFFTMADKLDLKVVKDRMQNFLLATNLVSVHRKMLMADQYKMKIVKAEVLRLYQSDRNILRSLSKSPEYAEFPAELVKDLLLPSACGFISG